jgi:hypothetical protein
VLRIQNAKLVEESTVGGEGRRAVRRRKESTSFLKKAWPAANQKTFDPTGVGTYIARARSSEVFFASFLFTKKKFFLCWFVAGRQGVDAGFPRQDVAKFGARCGLSWSFANYLRD